MNLKVLVRGETDADINTIGEITVEAFKSLDIGNHTEQFIIKALRDGDALTISLVAEVAGHIIGHIAFSHRRRLQTLFLPRLASIALPSVAPTSGSKFAADTRRRPRTFFYRFEIIYLNY